MTTKKTQETKTTSSIGKFWLEPPTAGGVSARTRVLKSLWGFGKDTSILAWDEVMRNYKKYIKGYELLDFSNENIKSQFLSTLVTLANLNIIPNIRYAVISVTKHWKTKEVLVGHIVTKSGAKFAMKSRPDVASVIVESVYENDELIIENLGSSQPTIKIQPFTDRGELKGAVAYAHLNDGTYPTALIDIKDKDRYMQDKHKDKGDDEKKPYHYSDDWGAEHLENIAVKKLWRKLPDIIDFPTSIWDSEDKKTNEALDDDPSGMTYTGDRETPPHQEIPSAPAMKEQVLEYEVVTLDGSKTITDALDNLGEGGRDGI